MKFPDLHLLHNRVANLLEQNRTALLCVVGIDRMSSLNALYGREVGDVVLESISERLALYASEGLFFRIGQDQFVFLLEKYEEEKLASRLNYIHETISLPVQVASKSIYFTVSIGISVIGIDAKSGDGAVSHAEMALKAVKQEGGKNWQRFTKEMKEAHQRKIHIQQELQTALQRNEFTLNYQPIVTHKGDIATVEALIRWNNELLGFVSPAEFIPVAEESGAIIEIGNWVLGEAAKMTNKLPPSISIAVNVSAKQLLDRQFISHIRTYLAKVPPGRIEIEVTETALMHNPELAAENLRQANYMGITSSIDDFGVGHSNLAYLHQFVVSKIKLDRSFVVNMLHQREARAICRAVASLGAELDLKVVGEGVETVEQAQALMDVGCYTFQGYLFEKPLPEAKLLTAIDKDYSALLKQ